VKLTLSIIPLVIVQLTDSVDDDDIWLPVNAPKLMLPTLTLQVCTA
jgi:hypothetical protein